MCICIYTYICNYFSIFIFQSVAFYIYSSVHCLFTLLYLLEVIPSQFIEIFIIHILHLHSILCVCVYIYIHIVVYLINFLYLDS